MFRLHVTYIFMRCHITQIFTVHSRIITIIIIMIIIERAFGFVERTKNRREYMIELQKKAKHVTNVKQTEQAKFYINLFGPQYVKCL